MMYYRAINRYSPMPETPSPPEEAQRLTLAETLAELGEAYQSIGRPLAAAALNGLELADLYNRIKDLSNRGLGAAGIARRLLMRAQKAQR
jgi:hypothetical protein